MANDGVKFTESGPVLIGGRMPTDVEGIGMEFRSDRVVVFWYLANGDRRDLTSDEMREWFING